MVMRNGLSLSHSSGFPRRRPMVFTSIDASRGGGSIDVKIIRLRQGNPEERREIVRIFVIRFPSFPRDSLGGDE